MTEEQSQPIEEDVILDENNKQEVADEQEKTSFFNKKCKNCEKPFIRNSPTHEICWRCKSKSGDVEL